MVTRHRLVTHNLVKAYGGRRVVDHVSISLEQGEIVGLLGPNGAGKTTTFNMVVGIVKPDEGTITLDGKDLSRMPLYKRARAGLGYLTQETSIFRKLTVEENLMSILEMTKLSRQQQRARLELLFDELSIGHLAKNYAYTLSGGERRRVEIARALAIEPIIMLLDEPFSGVDPKSVEELQEIIQQMRDRGLGILITDHSVRETLSVTDRAYIIHEGKILVQGAAEELVNNPEVRRLYLGERFYMEVPGQAREPAGKA
ncbi:MAG: Lipopolysaccharide export system ATP-binding protein LptB [candidate division BRC1 bacterium ADurb.BinA292]|nr:MAG: Lipopolysaccharide export system ATP-binding protein LptB [candidate division BRC1 bacterium ADurb.BinA292]